MPTLLTLNVEQNLQPKVEYLREGFGSDDDALRGAILCLPALLGYALDTRIRPRLEAILEAGFEPSVLVRCMTMIKENYEGWLHRRILKGKVSDGAAVGQTT